MPYGVKHTCSVCKSNESSIWKRNEDKSVMCLSCFQRLEDKTFIKDEPLDFDSGSISDKGSIKNGKGCGILTDRAVRKSTRIKPSRYKAQTSTKPLATKGKSRRVIFKKNPYKSVPSVATIITSEYIFHEGTYYQVGDIVSAMDEDDDGIYYAQIRGFLQDQYMDKSAVISWLLPTLSSPSVGFDPSTYVLGPEEDLPRRMECFDFVCHAPSEYYKAKYSPYPTLPSSPEVGYIWSELGPEILPVPTNSELYGLKSPDKERKVVSKDRTPKEDKEKQRERERRAIERDLDREKERKEREKDKVKQKKEAVKDRRERRERREKLEK